MSIDIIEISPLCKEAKELVSSFQFKVNRCVVSCTCNRVSIRIEWCYFAISIMDMVFSKNLNREKLIKRVAKELYLTNLDELAKRMRLYGLIYSGKIKPRAEYLFGLPEWEISPFQSVFFAFGDILFNPACADDYINAPIRIDDIEATTNFSKIFTENVIELCSDFISKTIELEKKYPEISEDEVQPFKFSPEITERERYKKEPTLQEVFAEYGKQLKREKVEKRRLFFNEKRYNIKTAILWSVLVAVVFSAVSAFATIKIDEYHHKQNAIHMSVTANAVCVRNNSVGNSWDIDYVLNGQESPDAEWFGKVWQGAKITVTTTVTELDSIDDVGKEKTVYKVTERDLRDGFSIEQIVEVQENRGQYAGSTAEWKIVYSFEP